VDDFDGAYGSSHFTFGGGNMNANSRRCVLISLSAIVICGESALAQTQQQDEERMRREGVERNDAAARAHGFEMERQRQERERREEEERRRSQSSPSPGGGYTPAPSGGSSAGTGADIRAERPKLLAMPPLPADRNVLLGSWRLEGSTQQSDARQSRIAELGITGKGSLKPGDLQEFISSMGSGQLACDMSFGRGITFTPTTYSSGGAAGIAGGPIAYRSPNKQVIVAIPGDARANPMFFEVAGPNRIVWGNTCALARVGTPAANAAANATTAPGNARTGAASPSAPPAASALPQVAAVAPAPPRSTLARPSPEVCRNTLLDKLGVVGTNQVRAMSDVRFKEAAIEGKVPNSNNLRIDLRGSACDDQRLKATLYDFDANEMLQSITYVWERPAGPAPAPIFTERVTQLSRFYSLPPPQSPGRLQADTSLGRLIIEDMPERNLLLEAYKAKK
jgi:hypothetical protein